MTFDSTTDWVAWWQRYRDEHLDLDDLLARRFAPGPERFLGRGKTSASLGRPFRLPPASVVREDLVPALQAALAASNSTDLTSACLIALARLGRQGSPTLRGELVTLFSARCFDTTEELAESAALALGILGDARAVPLLERLVGGDVYLKRRRTQHRTRVFAAYALGLIPLTSESTASVVSTLQDTFDRATGATPDLRVACLRALGALGSHLEDASTESRAGADRALGRWLLDRALDRTVAPGTRAQARLAIAQCLTGANLPDALRNDALDLLTGRRGRTTRAEETATVLALGALLMPGTQAPSRRSLERLLQARSQFAQPAALRRVPFAQAHAALRLEVSAPKLQHELRNVLLQGLARARGAQLRWHALALGWLEAERRSLGRPALVPLRRALLDALVRAKSPGDVSALAAAVALARVDEAVPYLLRRLPRAGTPAQRAHLVLCLAVLDARAAREPATELFERALYHPGVLRDAASALCLLGDSDVPARLAQRMATTSSQALQASLARALGDIGDHHSLDPLLSLLADDARPALARAFAAVALGRIGARALGQGEGRAVERYGSLLDPTSSPPTLLSDQGKGLLDIL